MNTIDQIRATLPKLGKQQQSDHLYSETFVYLIKNPDTGFIKIGFSSNPEKQLEQLKTGCPNAQLLTKFRGTRNDEGKLHKVFFERRIVREWFSLTENDVIAIQDYFKLESCKKCGELLSQDLYGEFFCENCKDNELQAYI